MTDLTCAQLHEMADELALGVLSGHERAEAMAHLTGCASCRQRVRELTAVADSLLNLVPAVEPPVGFEDRVMARLGFAPRVGAGNTGPLPYPTGPLPYTTGPMPALRSAPPRPPGGGGGHRSGNRPGSSRPGGRKRWIPALVAAGVAAAVFGIGGWALGTTQHPQVSNSASPTPSRAWPGDQDELQSADLMDSNHQQIGQVFAYQGKPSWVYMVVEIDGWSGKVNCQLEQRGGGTVDLGSFMLADGYGHWGASSSVNPDTVVGARLTSTDGTVLATATF